MNDTLARTGERILPQDIGSVEEYLSYLRHRFAYEHARDQVPEGLSWLEIGAGEGYGTSLLAQRSADVIGLDVDEKVVAHANRMYGSPRCRFELYRGAKLPFDSDRFDVVASFQVIEHVKDDNGFIAEAARVLRPDGILIITTPNRVFRLRPGQKPWNPYHYREYDHKGLHALLESYFSDVSVSGVVGREEAQKIEIESVKKGFQDIDIINLRRLVPKRIRPTLGRLVRRMTGRTVTRDGLDSAINRFSTADYFVNQDEPENSLDLLAFCRASHA